MLARQTDLEQAVMQLRSTMTLQQIADHLGLESREEARIVEAKARKKIHEALVATLESVRTVVLSLPYACGYTACLKDDGDDDNGCVRHRLEWALSGG